MTRSVGFGRVEYVVRSSSSSVDPLIGAIVGTAVVGTRLGVGELRGVGVQVGGSVPRGVQVGNIRTRGVELGRTGVELRVVVGEAAVLGLQPALIIIRLRKRSRLALMSLLLFVDVSAQHSLRSLQLMGE